MFRSKASIAGHPIHPMVVAFPIALYTATVVALLAYIGTTDSFYYRGAMVASISGVTMALLAALPGVIDLMALPRGSRARSTGIKHGSLAVLTTGIFAACAAVLYRNWGGRVIVDGQLQLDATLPLAIGVVGLVALVIVGALGWALVQTHHIGIKPSRLQKIAPPHAPGSYDAFPASAQRPSPYSTQNFARH